MLRKLLPSLCAAALCLPLPAAAAAPAQAGDASVERIFVVIIEFEDETDDGGLADLFRRRDFADVVKSGAGAVLSTRSASDEAAAARRNAFIALGAGARTARAADARRLVTALASEEIQTAGVGDPELGSVLGAGTSVLDSRGRPAGARVIFMSETVAHEGMIPFELDNDDMVIMLTALPSTSRFERRVFLGGIALSGPGIERGLLRSATTRRAGIVALTDVAPTILGALGVQVPSGMTGRPMISVPATNAAARLRHLDRDLEHAAGLRSPLLRVLIYGAAALAVAIAALIAYHKKVPRSLALLLVAVCAAPFAILLEPVLPGSDTIGSAAAWITGIACTSAFAATASFGWRRGPALICSATALLILADVVAGGSLAHRSAVSYLLAEGSRFYGIGNELMGVVIGSLLAGFVVLNEEAPGSRAVALAGPLVLAAAVWILASPSLGAKFGAVLTAVPAFGLLAARAGGRRTTIPLVAVLEAGAGIVTGLVYLSDRLRPAADRSHIGGAAGTAAGTLARKLGAAIRLAAFSFWMVALLAFAGGFLLIAFRRREDVRRLFSSRPLFGSLLPASGLAALSAMLFNDAGTIAATFIALYTLTLFLLVFAAQNEGHTLAA